MVINTFPDLTSIFNHRLQQTQNLLYESTKDFLQLKFDTRTHEESWMVEKDQLLRELDSCQVRKTGSAGSERRQPLQRSSNTPRPLSKPQLESQQAHKHELKVILFLVSSKIICTVYQLVSGQNKSLFLIYVRINSK